MRYLDVGDDYPRHLCLVPHGEAVESGAHYVKVSGFSQPGTRVLLPIARQAMRPVPAHT